jgi:hypothetical protein
MRSQSETARPDLARAPFTAEQVESLNDFQRSSAFHPFTCSGGGGPHSDTAEQYAVLQATEDGWRCPVLGCKHRQDWAHTWMADGSWREAQEEAARFWRVSADG